MLKSFYFYFILALCLGTGAVTASTWQAPFLLDDQPKIAMNEDLQSWSKFTEGVLRKPSPLKSLNSLDSSRPLPYFTFALNWQMGSMKGPKEESPPPYYFRWFNIVLHGFNAFLVFLLFESLFQNWKTPDRKLALFISLLFWIGPLTLGTATYIYARSDVMMAGFVLLALLAALKTRPIYIILATTLALLCHAGAVVTPALLFLVTTEFSAVIVSFMVVLLYLILRWALFGSLGDFQAPATIDPSVYLFFFPMAVKNYFVIALTGIGSSLDHFLAAPVSSPLSLFVLVGIAGLLTLCFFIFYKGRGFYKQLCFGFLFAIICLIPTSTLFPTTDFLAERRFYLGSIGLFLMILLVLKKLITRFQIGHSLFLGIFTAWAVFLGWQSFKTLEQRASAESFWRVTLAESPLSYRALSNLANILNEKNKDDESLALYNRLLELYPNHYFAWFNRGKLLSKRSSSVYNPKLAIESLQNGLQVNPQNRKAHCDLSFLLKDTDVVKATQEQQLCEAP
jgi:tetratricopeptide (TPR) repeat protein